MLFRSKSFGDDINKMTQMVTWESIPSSGLGLEINGQSPEMKRLFTQEAMNIIAPGGVDELAAKLGVHIAYANPAEGAYDHSINPNVISGLIPKKPLGKGDWSIDEFRRYASGIQYIFRQDAVPWLRPDSNPLTSKAAIDDQKFRVVKNGRTVPNSRFDTLKEAQEFAAKKGGEVVGGKFARGVLLEKIGRAHV